MKKYTLYYRNKGQKQTMKSIHNSKEEAYNHAQNLAVAEFFSQGKHPGMYDEFDVGKMITRQSFIREFDDYTNCQCKCNCSQVGCEPQSVRYMKDASL